MIRKWHGLAFVLAVGSAAALTSSVACSRGSGGGSDAGAGSPAVFVIDSTGTLFSFDSQGNSLAHVAVPTPIGALNGGGIAVASGVLYVTIGQPTNAVSAYTTSLAPQTLPGGAFSPLAVPRGIVYDPNDSEFYVGNGATGGTPVFNASGSPVTVTGGFPDSYGMSGVAYDPDDGTLWVANYVGAPSATPPMYGVAEYTENGAAAQTIDYATQFAPPQITAEPYAIAVCPKSATGGTTLIVVGFTGFEVGGIEYVQPFTTSGAPVGPALTGSLGGLSALSCDADGNVYIADAHGLFRNTVTSAGFTPGQNASFVSSGFAGLTPPIYGVFAGPLPASGSTPDGGGDATMTDGGGGDGGASDAALQADGNGAGIPIPDDVDGGPLAWCEQNSVLGPINPADDTWVAVPDPYEPGYFCCLTEPDIWNVDVCENGYPLTNVARVTCYDYAQDCVGYYFSGTATLTSPGGLTPSGLERYNCSSAPPGYPVPSGYLPPSPSNPGGAKSPTGPDGGAWTCDQYPTFCNCVCDEGSASTPGGPY